MAWIQRNFFLSLIKNYLLNIRCIIKLSVSQTPRNIEASIENYRKLYLSGIAARNTEASILKLRYFYRKLYLSGTAAGKFRKLCASKSQVFCVS